LLHVLKSLKSTGKGAVILPHGVLFRGGAEATIRKALIGRGYIKGIIGLPANLFYGTGIPACIVVLDKENAQARTGIFMIDASKGFMKDGPKNRLRSQDLHKIVDVFNRQIELDRYSRMVPTAEIADPKNNYNLNIPRYIDPSEPEDLQDLHAHLHGGIPNRDLDALAAYWEAFPQLRSQLFKPNRPGYSDLAIGVSGVQQTILDSPEFQKFADAVGHLTTKWFNDHREALANIDANTRPNALIGIISDKLLARFKSVPLLDEYDVYEQLMTYWRSIMHDDVFLIMNEGWLAAAKPRTAVEDKDRKLAETPDLETGTGRNKTKFKMDLIPPEVIVARYHADDQARIDELNAGWEVAAQAVEEYAEEHGAEEGLLSDAVNDKGKVTQSAAKNVLNTAKAADDEETVDCAKKALDLLQAEVAAKKAAKDALTALDTAALKKYGDLTEAEVRAIVLEDKWAAAIRNRVAGEVDALTLNLVNRIQDLGERYAETVGVLIAELELLEARVAGHLAKMGVL
ncbi:MAG: SAM-dependent methyltransferase, partial [Actinobacteria bacterium]|nr:SAM-dependent methyltransferase [Actinomycetota bacterium]